jgi:hypothetical protein
MAKSKLNLRPAAPELVKTVHKKLLDRAIREIPQQPSDDSAWSVEAWRLGATSQSKEILKKWAHWSEGAGKTTLTPAVAAIGFPETLDVWSWYAETQGKPRKNGRTPSPYE